MSIVPRLLGEDLRIKNIIQIITKVADTKATVLITGESGTGKEIIAKLLYFNSSRNKKPFISINCGAICENLQESELFGHHRGSFTGAISNKIGKFEAADGGTLFLDEISEMKNKTQVKLLRFLQTGEYSPIGVAENHYVDVRLIAATNQDLMNLIRNGKFRNDLYYRLNVIQIDIPPLRERKADIPLLIDFFIKKYSNIYNKQNIKISSHGVKKLLNHNYPGNVRELENIVEREVILYRHDSEAFSDLNLNFYADVNNSNKHKEIDFHRAKKEIIEKFEKEYLVNMLKESRGVISSAANRSGLSERNFHEKLKKYSIKGKEFKKNAINDKFN